MVSEYPFDYIYFADTHGNMDLEKDFPRFDSGIDILKKHNKKVGFHLHDHSGKAYWNYKQLSGKDIDSSDTSVRGMGKGSGNLKLEFVTDDFIELSEFIRKYDELLTLKPNPYELVTAKYSLTDNYAKEANKLSLDISDFRRFCETIIGVDKDTYNKTLLTKFI